MNLLPLDQLLIPKSIIELCREDRFDISIVMTGVAARGRWPEVELYIGNKLIKSGAIDNTQTWTFSQSIEDCSVPIDLKICYVNKTDADTVVDQHGTIIENQHVSIDRLLVNDIDIVANSSIYQFGICTMQLSKEKEKFFIENNINVGPTHNLKMFENSTWQLTFNSPVSADIASKKSFYFTHEAVNKDVYTEIYKKILRIKTLEAELIKHTKGKL